MGSIGLVGPNCMWIAWLLLLLTCLGLPIVDGIYLMKVAFTLADGRKGDMRFGVFGMCVYGVKPTDLGFTDANFFGTQCTNRGLGWTTRTIDTTQVADVVFAGVTWSLVLHPVACAASISAVFLLVLAWLLSLTGLPGFMYRRGERLNTTLKEFLGLFFSLFPLGMYITASIVTTVTFILDMIIVGEGQTRARANKQAHTSVSFGPIPWMTFVAMLLVWIGTIEAFRSSFSFGPGRKITHRPIDW